MADLGKEYVQILPSMRGFQGALESGGNAAVAGAGSKWGSALKGALAVGAVAAVVTGFKDLIKLGGQYEQTVGGVKKIFNDVNYDIIKSDAANAYKTMGISAQDYQESLNQVGASLAGNMGDKKAYETAKTGLKAVADFATGTGRSVDLMNEKWQLLNKGASTYQSVADQFAGLLPATSQGFLDQAKAAGLLSKEYISLNQIPVAEYQQALAAMAVNGTSNLGLLDNAMVESRDTVTGSWSAMTSSLKNFFANLTAGDESEAGKAFENFLQSAGDFTKNVKDMISTAFGTLTDMIADSIQKWLGEDDFETLQKNIANIKKPFTDFFEQIKEGFRLAAEKTDGFDGTLKFLKETGKTIFTVFDKINDLLTVDLPKGFDKSSKAANPFSEVLDVIDSTLGEIGRGLKGFTDWLNGNNKGAPPKDRPGNKSTKNVDLPVNNITINSSGLDEKLLAKEIERVLRYA